MNFSNESNLNYCETGDGDCKLYISVIIAVINLLSIAINLLHLLILRKIPSLHGSPYYWILVNITLSDIFVSAVAVLGSNCELQKYLVLSQNYKLGFLLRCVYSFGSRRQFSMTTSPSLTHVP